MKKDGFFGETKISKIWEKAANLILNEDKMVNSFQMPFCDHILEDSLDLWKISQYDIEDIENGNFS